MQNTNTLFLARHIISVFVITTRLLHKPLVIENIVQSRSLLRIMVGHTHKQSLEGVGKDFLRLTLNFAPELFLFFLE